MLVYHQTKEKFIHDVLNNEIADNVKKALLNCGINDQNESEYNSWNSSLQFMRNVIDDPAIPNNVEISIEYEIPLTSKRVDFIISGNDGNGKDNVVIIELKQWTTAEKINSVQTHSVMTFVGGAERTVSHPCYQAYSYAVHIKNYSEEVSAGDIGLHPCAYCHNFREENRKQLEDSIYSPWIEEAPLFLKTDMLKLREFIKRFIVKKSNCGDLLYRIDCGRIRPTKALQDSLTSMLEGNEEFLLLDEQSTVYDKVLKAISDSESDHQKRVVIIQGGPGTGKSVLAVHLLVDLINLGMNTSYVTKNSAPRNCYLKLLSGSNVKQEVNIKDLFRSPFNLCSLPLNSYDCLLIDEAHRLVKKMYGDFKGNNQIKECIEASRVSVFFIDENQRITTSDIGTVSSIVEMAASIGVGHDRILFGEEYILSSQFRCNGSDGYIAFLDNFLGIKKTANRTLDINQFDFRVYFDVNKMRDDLRELNKEKNKARMVAGYTFDWNVKHGRGEFDISLPGDFKARWNLANDSFWAINPESFEEIGCIHTAQGLEFDYCGVIIGNDLIYRNGQVLTNRDAISKDDRTSKIRSCKDPIEADLLIRNTYKVLLSRGQRGCFVYCQDEQLANYLSSFVRLRQA